MHASWVECNIDLNINYVKTSIDCYALYLQFMKSKQVVWDRIPISCPSWVRIPTVYGVGAAYCIDWLHHSDLECIMVQYEVAMYAYFYSFWAWSNAIQYILWGSAVGARARGVGKTWFGVRLPYRMGRIGCSCFSGVPFLYVYCTYVPTALIVCSRFKNTVEEKKQKKEKKRIIERTLRILESLAAACYWWRPEQQFLLLHPRPQLLW